MNELRREPNRAQSASSSAMRSPNSIKRNPSSPSKIFNQYKRSPFRQESQDNSEGTQVSTGGQYLPQRKINISPCKGGALKKSCTEYMEDQGI